MFKSIYYAKLLKVINFSDAGVAPEYRRHKATIDPVQQRWYSSENRCQHFIHNEAE